MELDKLDPNTVAILGLILTPLVAVLFFWLGLSQRKPKLIGSGGGSGNIQIPGRDVMATSVSIRNEPTFFGMRAPRDTAQIESARLYDPDLKEYIGPVLVWREEGTNTCVSRVAIESGKQANLYVFGKDRWSQDFFVFSGTALNDPLPERLTVLPRDKRDYEIHLVDTIGRRYKFRITARNGDQSVSASFKLTMHQRLQMISRGLRMIRSAFRVRQ